MDIAADRAEPSLDAVNALRHFGINLPANAVDPVLELVKPQLAAGGALRTETVDLLIQLYWAVPVLDVTAPRVLVTDPSAQVRANLASRVSELVPEVIAALRSDEHPDVMRALASIMERTAG